MARSETPSTYGTLLASSIEHQAEMGMQKNLQEHTENPIEIGVKRLMDALDEFFREWCEPEAWCERCTMYPAIHVVIHDDEAAYGSVVTYVRIWDPTVQTHIAVCRRCSQEHIAALGTPEFKYALETLPLPASSRARALWLAWRRSWQACKRSLIVALRSCLWVRRRAPHCTDRARYTHTGT